MPAAGKTLEAFVRDALDAWIRTWHHNFENVGTQSNADKAQRPADKIAFLPPHGRGALIECKERRSTPDLPFAEVKLHQERQLYAAAATGAHALVATSFKERGRWRVFLIRYTDFAHLRRTLGRASIPLADAQRPPCVVELKKNEAATAWDLKRGVTELELRDAMPLYHLSPLQERRGF